MPVGLDGYGKSGSTNFKPTFIPYLLHGAARQMMMGGLAAALAVGEFDKLICFYCRDMFPFSMNFGHDHTASDDTNGLTGMGK